MGQTSDIKTVLTVAYLENEIQHEIKYSRDGFIPLMQASKWLAHYPRPEKVAQEHRFNSYSEEASITLQGFALISNELAKRDAPAKSDCDLSDTDYRKGGAGNTRVSLKLLCDVALAIKNEVLVVLINKTQQSRNLEHDTHKNFHRQGDEIASVEMQVTEGKRENPMTTSASPVLRTQEVQIVNWLVENGYEPKALPKAAAGKAGVKMLCRKALLKLSGSTFTESKFRKAWQRLREFDDIKDA